jgi:asparagine synthase (glutamine-hydrolysing)
MVCGFFMCGICGELRFDGLSPERATLSRMNEKLARREPDDEGLFVTGAMGFGQRRQ